ncbi:fatty acyl-AMP ligase [Streptomyces sp. HNM0663]|uniref:Fatty acyl-AMP ligase n=1 Tax=Streptomyces chengmaiensis TaxID=3040919 RepID=A0ABT6HHA0_9ACTN|nr:fatty acyl-AMP ligase [Streptomyces chengmaiensis]MDH2388058.1 fatty acyl-AMP ligase [Streptomyces chengmaiensis]
MALPPQHRTLTDAVRAGVEHCPERAALVYLHEDGSGMRPERLSYAELDRRARSIAVRLREATSARTARPVLLLFPPTVQFVTAFLGCFYAGRTAIPAPLPDEPGERLARVSAILRDASAGAVLTLPEHRQALAAWLAASGEGDVACLAVGGDGEDPAAAGMWTAPRVRDTDVAFLQYSSGSTSEPKGVMVTHANLAANQQAIGRAMAIPPGVVAGSWLPLYHDMGLIGMTLHPLWMAGTSVQMSPVSFIKQPHRWLRMIHDFRVQGTASPDFGYELCTRRVTEEQSAGLDLSSLHVALNGAEPVRSDTLRAFTARFSAHGLRPQALVPSYGLAENTLLVSGAVTGRPPGELKVDAHALEQDELREPRPGRTVRTLVSCGTPQDTEVLIVDPMTLRSLPDGRVGEIWLRGPSAAAGYWNRRELTAETFHAETADGRAGYLRTGDVGALHDGQLYVTGRIKEMLIHCGRNLYPQDLELAVQEMGPAFRRGGGAVFTVGDPHAGRTGVVVVQELRPRCYDEAGLPALAVSVRALLSREFQLSGASVVLVRPGAIRKTTSGKTQRTLMRQLFLSGDLPVLHQSLEPAAAALADEHPPQPTAAAGRAAHSAATVIPPAGPGR